MTLFKKKYVVTYLDCFGASTIYQEEWFCFALTKKQAFKKFMKAHPVLPTGYTCRERFNWKDMKEDIYLVNNHYLRKKNHTSKNGGRNV